MTHIHKRDAIVREFREDNGDYVIVLDVPGEIVPSSKHQWSLPIGDSGSRKAVVTVEGARRMAMEILAACDRVQKTTAPQLKRRT